MHTLLFCGYNKFQLAHDYTKLELENDDVIVLQSDIENIGDKLSNVDIIIPFMTQISKDVITRTPKLKLIMQYGVGLESVDITAATEANITVCNIPSNNCANALSCAEHAIFLALACLRKQNALNESLKHGRLGVPAGRTLFGSRSIIFGFGAIGKELAPRLKAFNSHVCAIVNKNLPIGISNEGLEEYKRIHSLDEISTLDDLAQYGLEADILFLCCNQRASNIGMLNREFISMLKPGIIIINVARGGLLNYDDVYEAVVDGRIGGLGIDVFHTEPFPSNDKLLQHVNVIATPHVAGVTERSYKDMARIVAENVRRLTTGEELIGAVNKLVPT